MNDDRLHRLLDSAARPTAPDPGFAAALLAELGDELGFVDAGGIRPIGGATTRRRARSHRRPLELLLIAIVVIGAAGGLVAAAGAIRDRLAPRTATSLLSELRRTGQVRIAIRPDHPQFELGGQVATGFDADVAAELARRLGLAPDIVIEDVATMLRQQRGEAWDIALPSVPTWTIDPSVFLTSAPYYRWPHLLVVRSTSRASTVADVGAGPVCAVAGDAGTSWLGGGYGSASAAPVSRALLTRATDADCLAALASGDAIAAVTADLSPADLAVRADLRVIGGPTPEPRGAIVSRPRDLAADPAELLSAVNATIAAMHADGTLTRLSQRRFGGDDLTAP